MNMENGQILTQDAESRMHKIKSKNGEVDLPIRD